MFEKKSQVDNSEQKAVFLMKDIRKATGMSQVKFAAAIGIDPATVSRAERGLTEPVFTILQVKRLLKLAQTSIEEMPDYLGKDYLQDENNNGSQI